MNAIILTIPNKYNNALSYCCMCGNFMYNSDVKIVPATYLRRARTCQNCFLKTVSYVQGQMGQNSHLQAQMDKHADVADITSVPDTQQILTFADDVPVQSFEKPFPDSVSQWTSMAQDQKEHTIKDILQRPVIVMRNTFVDASVSPSGLGTPVSLKFPDILLQSSTNIVNKLNYFTFFRANIKVKLVFNATPFQSGRYWMYFAPYDVVSNRPTRSYLPNQTGFPGTEIDLASGSAVELKIPYCAPLSHYNLVDGHSNMGHLYMSAIQPLASGTTGDTAGFTLFAWFEDIELAMPTSVPVLVPTLEAQIMTESAEKSDRPISGSFSRLGGLASFVADNVPILSSFARPVAWVSRIAAGVASTFGFNKPISIQDNSAIYNVPAKGFTHMDGSDHSVVLAAAPDNGLTLPKGLFSTDVDEMDLKYVCSKSCVFDTFTWTSANAVGTNLSYFPVIPGVTNYARIATLDYGVTTIGYVSSMFRLWRGGLKYRLVASKTAFHTGRIRVTFHPAVFLPVGSDATYSNAYSWVLDLSASSELEFEIPYVSNMPWKQTYVGTPDEINAIGENYSPGLVTIQVLNPLRVANASASSTVGLNLWISGANDLSFAIPSFSENAPSAWNGEPTLEAQILNETAKGVEHNEQVVDSSVNLFGMRSMSNFMAEQLTIGEKISSLRQLTRRFGIAHTNYPQPWRQTGDPSKYSYMGSRPSTDFNLTRTIALDPAYFGDMASNFYDNQIVASAAVSRAADGSLTNADCDIGTYTSRVTPLQYISYLYRFYTGGKRYKVFQTVNSNPTTQTGSIADVTTGLPNQLLIQNALVRDRSALPLRVSKKSDLLVNGAIQPPNPVTSNTESLLPDTNFRHIVYPDLNGVCEFEVPYYSQVPISVVGEGTMNDVEGICVARSKIVISRGFSLREFECPNVLFNAASPYPETFEAVQTAFGGAQIYEAAADDFTFGYLVGAPAITRLVG